jgi:hypothetical protein
MNGIDRKRDLNCEIELSKGTWAYYAERDAERRVANDAQMQTEPESARPLKQELDIFHLHCIPHLVRNRHVNLKLCHFSPRFIFDPASGVEVRSVRRWRPGGLACVADSQGAMFRCRS